MSYYQQTLNPYSPQLLSPQRATRPQFQISSPGYVQSVQKMPITLQNSINHMIQPGMFLPRASVMLRGNVPVPYFQSPFNKQVQQSNDDKELEEAINTLKNEQKELKERIQKLEEERDQINQQQQELEQIIQGQNQQE